MPELLEGAAAAESPTGGVAAAATAPQLQAVAMDLPDDATMSVDSSESLDHQDEGDAVDDEGGGGPQVSSCRAPPLDVDGR